jgi:hypothetical protein
MMKVELTPYPGCLPLLVLLVMVMLMIPTLAASPQRQPNMEGALGHLRQAEASLAKAESNKGGHREKAMELIKQAESEVRAGMAYYDTHEKR